MNVSCIMDTMHRSKWYDMYALMLPDYGLGMYNLYSVSILLTSNAKCSFNMSNDPW